MRFTIDTDKVPLLIPDCGDFKEGAQSAEQMRDLYKEKLTGANQRIVRIEDTECSGTLGEMVFTWQVFYKDDRMPYCKLVVRRKGDRYYPHSYMDFIL